MWVRGEITRFQRHARGHWYFTLKGESASLRCAMWGTNAARMPAMPDEGMEVAVFGQLEVYAARTDVQLIVKRFEAAGDGLWKKAFDEVRRALQADGLLDPLRKRPLPYFPRCVAVITSQDGAALHDIVAVIKGRNPAVEIVLIPASVQGEDAPASLVRALKMLHKWKGADVAIIGRGGGSREDLWAFNNDRVARAIAACAVPIICAVGHEIDTSICDLVADLSAPTPSAAAERAVPPLAEMRREARRLSRRLVESTSAVLKQSRIRLDRVARRSLLAAPQLVDRRRLRLEGLAGRLNALSPLATMARGFAVVTDADDRVVTKVAGIRTDDQLTVRLPDGSLTARVIEVHDGEPNLPARA